MSSPTLTSVTIVSNNTIKTNYAGTDDEVTLSITASENINQPTVVFTSNSQSINNTSVTYSGSNT